MRSECCSTNLLSQLRVEAGTRGLLSLQGILRTRNAAQAPGEIGTSWEAQQWVPLKAGDWQVGQGMREVKPGRVLGRRPWAARAYDHPAALRSEAYSSHAT